MSHYFRTDFFPLTDNYHGQERANSFIGNGFDNGFGYGNKCCNCADDSIRFDNGQGCRNDGFVNGAEFFGARQSAPIYGYIDGRNEYGAGFYGGRCQPFERRDNYCMGCYQGNPYVNRFGYTGCIAPNNAKPYPFYQRNY